MAENSRLSYVKLSAADLTPEHYDQLDSIDPFISRTTPNDFLTEQKRQKSNFLIAYLGKEAVGYIKYYLPGAHAHGKKVVGKRIFVRSNQRNKDIARKMSYNLIGYASDKLKMPFTIIDQNLAMRTLARKMHKKERRGYYGRDKKRSSGPVENFEWTHRGLDVTISPSKARIRKK